MNIVSINDYIEEMSYYDNDIDYNEVYEDELIVINSEDSNSDLESIISYTTNNSFSDENDDNNWFEISEEEEEYELIPKENEKYYIGLPGYIKKFQEYILLSSISVNSFLKYKIEDVCNYLTDYSISYISNPSIHIMKLYIKDNGVYNVVLKTHWLRLIQRKWKKIYEKKQNIMKKRSSIKNILLREIKGKYNNYLDNYPSINGMLYDLQLKNTTIISPEENTNKTF